MRTRAVLTWLLLASPLSVFSSLEAQQTNVTLEIELLALERGHPERPMRAISRTWSLHDHEDSVVVRVRVKRLRQGAPAGVMAHVQYQAGRRVSVTDNSEVMDPEATARGSRWLPSLHSMEASLTDAESTPEGDIVVEMGVARPLTAQRHYEAFDDALVLTRLAVEVSLIRQGGDQYVPGEHALREIRIAW